MKKLLAVQITALLLIAGGLVSMWVVTPAYSEIKAGIVDVLCLSCLKLQPKTSSEFVFATANNESHPSFVFDNLTRGIVFLEWSGDSCLGCDIMFPVIQDLFDLTYDKQDMVSRHLVFEGNNITFYYTNIHHAIPERVSSQFIYDKDHVNGIPMFTVVTLGYDHGTVRPMYTTLYGTLLLDTDAERLALLTDILEQSIQIYHENSEGFHH